MDEQTNRRTTTRTNSSTVTQVRTVKMRTMQI